MLCRTVGVLILRSNQGEQLKKPAGFSYEEFFARLTHWADATCGIQVTDRMVRDWCDEKLLPGPTRRGLGRGKGFRVAWDSLAYRRACRICRFKKQGATRFDEFRVLLWMSGEYVNIKELRVACLGELTRHRASAALSTRSNADLADPQPSPRTIKAFEKRGAQVDGRIVPANFKYSGREAMEMLAVLKTGESPTNFAQSLVDAVGLPSEMQIDIASLISPFSGLLANPNESPVSGQAALENAEAIHFKQAKVIFWKMASALSRLQDIPNITNFPFANAIDLKSFMEVHKGLMQPNFKVLNFIALVCALQRGSWPPKINSSPELAK